MSKRTHYTDEQRAEALAALDANGGNVSGTADDLGIPRGTLRRWDKARENAAPAQLRHEKRDDLADRMEALAHTLLDDVLDSENAAARRIGKINEVSTAIAIAIDKARLLRGEATNITENRTEGAKERVIHRLDRIAKAQSN